MKNMQVTAKAKTVRISPRKVRLVLDQVRGLSVADAQQTLKYMNKGAAEPVLKLINSAKANAENNFNLNSDNLYIAEIKADEGFTIKRFRPRAFGRAGMIRKRTSHITVVLDEKADQTAKKDTKKAVSN